MVVQLFLGVIIHYNTSHQSVTILKGSAEGHQLHRTS
ncbi:hypothetical protein VULLAG_LOCUS1349 [Vulpes lagopus]